MANKTYYIGSARGQIYEHTNAELATEWVAEITRDFCDEPMPFEICRLGRTIGK